VRREALDRALHLGAQRVLAAEPVQKAARSRRKAAAEPVVVEEPVVAKKATRSRRKAVAEPVAVEPEPPKKATRSRRKAVAPVE